MTDVSNFGMVSYCNPFPMYRQQQQPNGQPSLQQSVQQHVPGQQHGTTGSTVADNGQQYWYPSGYSHSHTANHHQASASQQYIEHPEMFTWASHYPAHFQYPHHQMAAYQQQQQQNGQQMVVGSDWSGDEGNNANASAGEPSPPMTVTSSEIGSPRTPSTPPNNNNTVTANNNNNNNTNSNSDNNAASTPGRPAQLRSPYEWMKRPSYQSQPNPGKTRTKDKYRVVYTDHQRLELEKEFHFSRYITIRRKTELAQSLALSERQVKIWFQNRRAKERKQAKKRDELEKKDSKEGILSGSGINSIGPFGMGGMLSSLIHSTGSPPLSLTHSPHGLPLAHPSSALHAHAHQHPHSVLGL